MKDKTISLREPVAKALALAIVSGLYSIGAHASDITQTSSNTIGLSWNTPGTWSNNAAPSAGNDYITLGYELRTPDLPSSGGSTTFGGHSLTIDKNSGGTRGILRLKATTTTIDRLTLGAAQIIGNISDGTNRPGTLNIGTLTVTGNSGSNQHSGIAGAATGNHLTLNVGNLVGSGHLRFEGTQSHYLNIQNADTYTGAIHLAGGNMWLNDALSLSRGSFIMNDTGVTLRLEHNLNVTSFTFGGTLIDYGTYSVSQLNSLLNTNAFSGEGLLTVAAIPEASTFAMIISLSAGVGISAFFRRRRTRR